MVLLETSHQLPFSFCPPRALTFDLLSSESRGVVDVDAVLGCFVSQARTTPVALLKIHINIESLTHLPEQNLPLIRRA